MSTHPVHVFISSTWLDLQPEREAVEAALKWMRETKFASMEYFGSRDENTRSTSLAEVDRSQVYVGLFGGRYGSGITEAAYRRARERKLHCFIYVKEEGCITSDEREADADTTHRLMALKDDLRRNHTITEFANPHELAAKVTADLHRWLFDEYLAPQLEGAAQGQLSPDETRTLLEAIKDSSMLNQGLRERLEKAGFVLAGDERSIAVGGSAYYSPLIPGDHNIIIQTINQRYPALKDYASAFSELINTTTSGFVGRELIFKRLEEFQKRNPCGYLRIVADSGLGKTALAAEVARRYEAPAFFVDASGRTEPALCLKYLSAQLIARFGLAHDHLPDQAGEGSIFLGQMLAEAAQKASGPLWIVVDALDEADKPSPGQNTLLLPGHLPQGVYFLLTHRPGEYLLATDARTPVGEYPIAWDAPDQKTDIRTYLRSQAEKPAIRRALAMATPPIPEERFITVLQEKSEGNFKYLDYVITDIAFRKPGFVPLNLDTLPIGLRGYYEQFWSHMAPAPEEDRREVWEEWDQIYRPVIAFLGAAREPVTAEWLAALVGWPARKIRERVLRRWQRFLHQDQEQRTWRVVHRSFTDFLAEKMEADWRAFHERIADRYLTAWGGLEAGLPGLHDLVKLDMDVRYGLSHLAAHLEAADREDKLHCLLRLEWSDHQGDQTRARFENVWYTVHERVGDTSGYLSDVDRAWRLTEETFADRRSSIAIGLQCRYALIVSSLCSLAGNIPPELLTALVAKGIWPGPQGLAYARQIQKPELRTRALAALAPDLEPTERDQALREALEAAQHIGDWQDRSQALVALAPHLGADGAGPGPTRAGPGPTRGVEGDMGDPAVPSHAW